MKTNLENEKSEITLVDVQNNCRYQCSNKSLSYHGMYIGVCHSPDEIEAVQDELLRITRNDSLSELIDLKMKIQKGNAKCLVRPKLKEVTYNTSAGINCIVDTKNNVVFNLISFEILDICSDLKRGKTIDYLIESYVENDAFTFYHEPMEIELLKLFVTYWKKGMLNNLLKFICECSNSDDGLKDWGTGYIIRNRDLDDYICPIEDEN